MTTQELINNALTRNSNWPVQIWWDDQDPENEGPAYRLRSADMESAPLQHFGWLRDGEKVTGEEVAGYQLADFFTGPDGAYVGPDQDGIYPNLRA